MYLKRFVYDRLLDWKNENKTIQFGNRHQCIASRGISGTA